MKISLILAALAIAPGLAYAFLGAAPDPLANPSPMDLSIPDPATTPPLPEPIPPVKPKAMGKPKVQASTKPQPAAPAPVGKSTDVQAMANRMIECAPLAGNLERYTQCMGLAQQKGN